MKQRVVTCGLVGAIAAATWTSAARAQPAPLPTAPPAPAAAPTPEGTASAPATRPDRFTGPRFERSGPGGGWSRRTEPPTADEWSAIEAFMKENTPVRLDMLKRIEDAMGTDRPIPLEVRRRMGYRYGELESMKRRESPVYPFALKRIRLEDEVMGSLRELRNANDAEKAAVEKKLLAQVRSSVDNTLDERRLRIEQLRASLDRESKALANDEQDIDKLVDAQRQKFEKEMAAMLDFGKPGTTPTTQVASDGR